MDLRDYRVQPDEGLFEKISQRVRRRRLMRRAGAGSAVAVVVIVASVLLWPSGDKDEFVAGPQLAQVQQPLSSANTTPAAEPVAAASPMATEVTPAVEPTTVAMTVAKEEASVPSIIAEVDGNLTSLVPSYNHVASDLPLPSEPQQELRRGCIHEGCTIVEKEPTEEEREQRVSSDRKSAENPSEPPVHEDNLFWAPNIIVPSGDVDVNRTFSMRFTSAVSYFHIYIYNRAGHQVYQSTDPSFVWDGTSKGTTLPQGAYVWVMKFRDTNGKLHEARGSVTIIR